MESKIKVNSSTVSDVNGGVFLQIGDSSLYIQARLFTSKIIGLDGTLNQAYSCTLNSSYNIIRLIKYGTTKWEIWLNGTMVLTGTNFQSGNTNSVQFGVAFQQISNADIDYIYYSTDAIADNVLVGSFNYPILPYYITTTGNSNYSLTSADTITLLTIPVTTPTNTSIKGLFSVDGRQNWLYKDGTGIHKYTGDLTQTLTNYNSNTELQTYFSNLTMTQLTNDLSSLGIVPMSLDLFIQLVSSDGLNTPTLSAPTLVYVTMSHEEFGLLGDYTSLKADYAIKKINDSSFVLKNLTSTTKTIKVNVVLGTS
jgi:hypothetical protein